MVTQTITLSMIPGGVTPRIYASQNDHGLRVFVFNLVDENGGYAIPSGTTALLNVLKPDRTVVSETCTWSGSTVTADCTEQMTAVAGNVHCEVRLVAANGDAVGSANFILGVESNPLASGVVSESDFDSISDMVDRAVAAASVPPTYVTDWLDENITQETGYVIDKSLTIENAAADAKAAGDLIRASFVVGEASGSVASFTDGADNVPVKDLVVNIQPKQAGTGDPSPSNVRAISGWTEANIYRFGKNIFSSPNAENDTVEKESTPYYGTIFPYSLPQTTVTISAVVSTDAPNATQCRIALRNATGGAVMNTYLPVSAPNRSSVTINLTSYEKVDRIYWYSAAATSDTNSATFTDIQIEIGSTATAYEPHNVTTYPVFFGSSAGTVYGGTLDVTTGMLTVDKAIVTYDGTTTVLTGKINNQNVFYAPRQACALLSDYRGEMYSDRMPTLKDRTYLNGVVGVSGATSTAAQGYLYISNGDESTTVTEMNTWLITNPVTIVYPLATPITYQLTPTEVASLLGNNNIWSDTGSVASCEYRADTKLYLEKLTNPDDDMVANANITSGSYFMVNNNLYLATANIANGGAITPGTNCTATNLAAALNAINS